MTVRQKIAAFIAGHTSESSRLEYSDIAMLREALSDFNAQQRREGWAPTGEEATALSRSFIQGVANDARWMYWKNPLIHRGVNLQADYVFGQGFTLSSPDADAQKVIESFMDDVRNRGVVTDIEALIRREIELQISGQLFFALYSDADTGALDIRVFDANTVEDIYRNPEDQEEPWFYKRVVQTERLNYATGKIEVVSVTQFHPDIFYRPADGERPETIGGHAVIWDAPIFHVKPGALLGMKWALCEFFSTLAWGKGYTGFLNDRATVAKALSRFSMKFTDSAKDKVAKSVSTITNALAARVAQGRNRGGETAGEAPSEAGNAAVLGAGRDLQAVNVSGATIQADEGRRFALQVFAGFGWPEQFFGDGSNGNHATAKTMDRPSELKVARRQRLWIRIFTTLATYALIKAAEAPSNRFTAQVEYDGATPKITRDGAAIPLDVAFPDILEHDLAQTVSAIDTASKHLPFPEVTARLLLSALKVENADELIAKADWKALDKKSAEKAPKTEDDSQKEAK